MKKIIPIILLVFIFSIGVASSVEVNVDKEIMLDLGETYESACHDIYFQAEDEGKTATVAIGKSTKIISEGETHEVNGVKFFVEENLYKPSVPAAKLTLSIIEEECQDIPSEEKQKDMTNEIDSEEKEIDKTGADKDDSGKGSAELKIDSPVKCKTATGLGCNFDKSDKQIFIKNKKKKEIDIIGFKGDCDWDGEKSLVDGEVKGFQLDCKGLPKSLELKFRYKGSTLRHQKEIPIQTEERVEPLKESKTQGGTHEDKRVKGDYGKGNLDHSLSCNVVENGFNCEAGKQDRIQLKNRKGKEIIVNGIEGDCRWDGERSLPNQEKDVFQIECKPSPARLELKFNYKGVPNSRKALLKLKGGKSEEGCSDIDGRNWYRKSSAEVSSVRNTLRGDKVEILSDESAKIEFGDKMISVEEGGRYTQAHDFQKAEMKIIDVNPEEGSVSLKVIRFIDNCEGSLLHEAICEGEYFTVHECSQGCSDGACLSEGTDVCGGCTIDEKCVDYGFRKGREYCALDGEMKKQLKNEGNCGNDFQCITNFCLDSNCVNPSVIQKVLNWMRLI
ncbi:MAG: hypothetical protein ACQEP1_03260 [Nanobdellota archaeon]